MNEKITELKINQKNKISYNVEPLILLTSKKIIRQLTFIMI